MLDLNTIKERADAATGGPWTACCANKPTGCSHVMHSDGMVAEVTKGPWGDDYPALRFVDEQGNPAGGGAIGARAEAYMEQIEYGDVSPEQALANKLFIAHSREDVPALVKENQQMRDMLGRNDVGSEAWCNDLRFLMETPSDTPAP